MIENIFKPPICTIIAGPNGAGKTTFALNYLPKVAETRNFINADLIAAGLSPLSPGRELIAASRLFLRELKHYVEAGESFAFETTLSGRSYLKMVDNLKAAGWRVELIYLALLNVELSIERVAERVAHGGHDVSLADLKRRFPRSLNNLLNHYAAKVDFTQCLLNAGAEPERVFDQEGEHQIIYSHDIYQRLQEMTAP